MIVRGIGLLLMLAWSASALAQGTPDCGSAEEQRRAGVQNIGRSCSGERVDALTCYNAARQLIDSFGEPKGLASCPDLDRAGLNAELARARKITALKGADASAALAAQLAADRLHELSYNTFKTYMCQYLAMHVAIETDMRADVVDEMLPVYLDRERKRVLGKDGDKALESRVDVVKEITFGTPRNGRVCGEITLWAPRRGVGLSGNAAADGRARAVSREIEAAYLEVKEKLQKAGSAMYQAFVPGGSDALVGRYIPEIDATIEAFAQRIRALLATHAEAKDAIFIPHATGPDRKLLGENYEDVSRSYERFLKWLERSVQK